MSNFQSKEAEMTLLGDIFQNNMIMAETVGALDQTDFTYKQHALIYNAMLEMFKKNTEINWITLATHLGDEKLKAVGGTTYLTQITEAPASPTTYREYIRIIKTMSHKRRLAAILEEANEMVTSEQDPEEVIQFLQNQFMKNRSTRRKELTPISVALEKIFIDIADRTENGNKIGGMSTGFNTLDNTIGGLNKGDLVVIAGRPSMGKTAFTLNLINGIPAEHNTGLFELEMSDSKIAYRLVSEKSRVGLKRLSREKLSDRELGRVSCAYGEINTKGNVFLDDSENLTLAEIAAKAKTAKIKYGLDIIIIDHIGKIRPENPRATRNDQVGAISNGLKNIAKELDVCVIVLSQLNREVEKRSGNVPTLADLRDSGNIEQDADIIMLLYREDYYKEQVDLSQPSTLEVIIDKNRDGETGSIYFNYYLNTQLIEERSLRKEEAVG